MNPWFISSLILLALWFIIWIIKPGLRREMFWVSLFTTPLGLTELLFVPEYWNPPSLFNLVARTGFDIESLIFSFSVGGIGAVLYESIINIKHQKLSKREKHKKIHRFHLFALTSPLLAFILLYMLTNLNPIYSASISMFIGGIAAILCRPDLKNKIFMGGTAFLILYFSFFLILNIAYPEFVLEVWNLSAISGILVLGIPLEELIFAFTFGMLWSSIYEHALWYRVMQ
jgi:hypothetical protein